MSLAPEFRHADRVLKSKGPVDGDGDGWVYDGTPRKRPATPAERAAGARLRAAGKAPAGAARGAAKKAAAAKKAPAGKKNPKQQRLDRFARAIKAVKGKDDAKRVKALIDQDFVLDKKDREALNALLNEHLGGKAPAAAKKAPVKAPNPKKVAAKKPEPKKDLAADPQLTGDGTRARREAAKQVAEGKRPAKKAAPKGPVTRAHEKLREAGLDIPPKKMAGRVPVKAADGKKPKLRDVARQSPELDLNPRKGFDFREHKIDGVKDERALAADAAAALVDRINAAGDEQTLERIKAGIMGPTKALLRKHPELLNHVNDVFKAKKRNLRESQGSNTAHGPKTNAWKRLWNRDLGRARTMKQLDRLEAQVASLRKQKRISANEHDQLMDAIEAKRQKVGGKHKSPRRFASIMREARANAAASHAARNKVKTPPGWNATPEPEQRDSFGNLPDGPETKAYNDLHAAKDENAVNRVINQAGDDYGRGAIDKKTRDEIWAEAERVRARLRGGDKKTGEPQKVGTRGGTVTPPANPGVARAAAWEQRFKEADAKDNPNERVSILDKMMSDLEADKTLSDAEFQRIADNLNDRMEQVGLDLDAMVRIKGWFKAPIDPKHKEALDKHFADPKKSIGDAPQEGLFQWIVQHGEGRFDVKRQESNKGVSGIDIITDKVTGQRWFAKHSEFNNDWGKEKLAADILNALGLSKHKSKVGFGAKYKRHNPDGLGIGMDKDGYVEYEGQTLFLQDVVQGNGLKGKLKTAFGMNHDDIAKEADEEVEKGLKKHDQQGLINLLAFDFLIDNSQDRHAKNAFFEQAGEGLKVQFLDHGLAFGGHRNDMDPGVSVSEWFRSRYRANGLGRGGWNIAGLIGDSTQGRDDVARRLKKAIDLLARLDIDAMGNQYKRHMRNDPVAMQHYDAMMDLLRKRLAMLQDENAQRDLVRAVAMAGGF